MTISEIAIIGAGVRGTAALGRIAAQLRDHTAGEVTVHVIDEFPAGSGRIWRANQPRSLVMNTVAAQSTVFDDPTLGFAQGSRGPNFAEWCERVADGRIKQDSEWAFDSARKILPWSYPPRALYGYYLRWAFSEFARTLPEGSQLIEHRARATQVRRTDQGRFVIEIEPKTFLNAAESPCSASGETKPESRYECEVDSVLLALGWLPRSPDDGFDIPPGNPIDQKIERVQPGESVAVRGVGMGFTDLLGLVTEERGGRYSPRPSAARASELLYLPSGEEPTLLAGSRSALPFLAKPDFGRVPPAANFKSLLAAMPRLLAARPLHFGRDVLPLLERDAAAEFHRALAALHPEAYSASPLELLEEFAATEALTGLSSVATVHSLHERINYWRDIEHRIVPDPANHFDPWRVAEPLTGISADAIDAAIVDRLEHDAVEAALGMNSAWKRGLHVFQAARVAIVPLTDFGGITHEGAADLERFLTVAGLIGSGPPLFRVEQLLAAHRAGIVRFTGPGAVTKWVAGRRHLVAADGSATPVDRLFDARLDLPDPIRHRDPLLESLFADGAARLWPDGHPSLPPALEIAANDSSLIGADGSPVAGLHSVGPLHEEMRRFTIIAPIPGVRSTVLREVDAAVTALLSHATKQSSARAAGSTARPTGPTASER